MRFRFVSRKRFARSSLSAQRRNRYRLSHRFLEEFSADETFSGARNRAAHSARSRLLNCIVHDVGVVLDLQSAFAPRQSIFQGQMLSRGGCCSRSHAAGFRCRTRGFKTATTWKLALVLNGKADRFCNLYNDERLENAKHLLQRPIELYQAAGSNWLPVFLRTTDCFIACFPYLIRLHPAKCSCFR